MITSTRETAPWRRALAAVAAAAVAVALFASVSAAGVVEADDNSYAREVACSSLPVILEFTAVWCGACKKAGPEVERLAAELSGRVKVVRIDVDRARKTTSRFNVSSIPAFFYLEGGEVKGEAIGAMSRQKLVERLGIGEPARE